MLQKIRLSAVLVVFAWAALAADSYAATAAKVVCINAKGAVIVRSKCRKKETLLSSVSLNQSIASSPDSAGPAGIPGVQGVIGPIGAAGPQGAQGAQGVVGQKGVTGQLDFSGCHLTSQSYDTNFFTTSDPILYAEVYCNQTTEYLLQDESVVNFFPGSEGTRVALQGRFPYHYPDSGSDKREYGVGIFANRFLIGGAGAFELTVRGVCCPR